MCHSNGAILTLLFFIHTELKQGVKTPPNTAISESDLAFTNVPGITTASEYDALYKQHFLHAGIT